MRSLVTLAASGLLLAACGAPPAAAIPSEPGRGGDVSHVADPLVYPVGPYGSQEGEVIANLSFLGKKDANGNGMVTDDPVVEMRLSDYYQDKNVKALAVLVAAEWCGPCKLEQHELITSWKQYQTDKAGVAYIEALIESADAKRSPADIGTIDRWAGQKWTDPNTKMDPQLIPFPMIADPTVKLGPYYPTPAFPMQIVIRTSDMTIQWRNVGYLPNGVESAIDSILNPM